MRLRLKLVNRRHGITSDSQEHHKIFHLGAVITYSQTVSRFVDVKELESMYYGHCYDGLSVLKVN